MATRVQKKTKKHYDSFETYINALVKKHQGGDYGVSKKSMGVLNMIVKQAGRELSERAKYGAKVAKRQTIMASDIGLAIKLVMPEDLAKHVMAAANKAVKNKAVRKSL